MPNASEWGCRDKTQYQRRIDARRAARRYTHVLGRLVAYRCLVCQHYHIGHPGPRKDRA